MGAPYIDWKIWKPKLGAVSDCDLARQIGCGLSAVKYMRRRLGIAPAPSPLAARRWQDWELALLGTEADEKIAIRIGANVRSVARKRKNLGIAPAYPERNHNGTPMSKSKTPKKYLSPEEFVRAWQTAKNMAHLMETTGHTYAALHGRAGKYRRLGVPLKKMPRSPHADTADWGSLAIFAQKVLDEYTVEQSVDRGTIGNAGKNSGHSDSENPQVQRERGRAKKENAGNPAPSPATIPAVDGETHSTDS